jgi:hypothetical protein
MPTNASIPFQVAIGFLAGLLTGRRVVVAGIRGHRIAAPSTYLT